MTTSQPHEKRCARCGQWWLTTHICPVQIGQVLPLPVLTPSGPFEVTTTDKLTAERDALRAEVESLTQQLKAGESFHAVAVQQRDAAWREVESLRAEVERLRTTIKNVATILQYGGWVGLDKAQSLAYMQALAVGSMPGGSLDSSLADLTDAIRAARAAQKGKT